MPYKLGIIITFELPGTHYFPMANALFPKVGYLANVHRHIFRFKCYINVSHANRDKEFICFKNYIINTIKTNWPCDDNGDIKFKTSSCEQIGIDLLELIPALEKVEVWEDNENGAIIEKS